MLSYVVLTDLRGGGAGRQPLETTLLQLLLLGSSRPTRAPRKHNVSYVWCRGRGPGLKSLLLLLIMMMMMMTITMTSTTISTRGPDLKYNWFHIYQNNRDK